MVEVETLDAVGRAYDAVVDAGLPIVRSIGMHTNDHMVSFYVKSPSGVDIEFGCQGREIDEATWQVGHYDAISYWGHRPVPSPS
jgi:3,4-dihydroxy-9,10-secoandrosta-1,3,5(10)-triene-9,17-dione 4,5-dioxygenase